MSLTPTAQKIIAQFAREWLEKVAADHSKRKTKEERDQ